MDVLGPEYDCDTCSKDRFSYYDPDRDCPDCPLTESFNQIEDGIRAKTGRIMVKGVLAELVQIKRRETKSKESPDYTKWPISYPREKLRALYRFIARLLADNDGKIDYQWDETTAALARIVSGRQAFASWARNWRPEEDETGK